MSSYYSPYAAASGFSAAQMAAAAAAAAAQTSQVTHIIIFFLQNLFSTTFPIFFFLNSVSVLHLQFCKCNFHFYFILLQDQWESS